MLFAVGPMTDAGITLHHEAFVGERTKLREAMEIGEHLGANTLHQGGVVWFEDGPPGRSRDRIDYLQTEAAHRKVPKFPVGLGPASHRYGAGQSCPACRTLRDDI